ncbi:MAG TPA: asparaginase [Feifaniaceae bacterium]|nr:asparaginase [Feifaniaceae bacterium]
MKKLMILSTGGTIACTQTESGLIPTLSADDILAFAPKAKSLGQLDTRTIFNLDSSNIQPEEWKMIAEEVYECLPNYDGIVILHGTDTMAYTASMLSFMLQNVDKPVVITGSQLPIGHPNTDAKQNLEQALITAASGLAGVFVVFDGTIMLGCRVAKVRTTSQNAFESINRPPVGSIRAGKVRLTAPPEPVHGALTLDDAIDASVFLLKLIPGTRPEVFDIIAKLGYRGVVIEGFGLGGLHCLRRNLLEGIKQLLDLDVAVLLTTQCRYEPSDPMVYETGRLAVELGILQAYDMTSECAVTKLMWVLAHASNPGDVRRMMATDYCGELSLPENTEAGHTI